MKAPVERWFFAAFLVSEVRPDVDPDELADDIAALVSEHGDYGRVEVGLLPSPQWLTPETLANLRAAAAKGPAS